MTGSGLRTPPAGFISQRRDKLWIVTDTQHMTLILRFIVDLDTTRMIFCILLNYRLYYIGRNHRPLRLFDRQIAINIVNNTNQRKALQHITLHQTLPFLIATWRASDIEREEEREKDAERGKGKRERESKRGEKRKISRKTPFFYSLRKIETYHFSVRGRTYINQLH